MKPVRQMIIVVNADKKGAVAVGEDLKRSGQKLGCRIDVCNTWPLNAGSLRGADACCVIGGDGTLLGVVAGALRWKVPVFGVNQGKLGFLATYSVERIRRDFAAILGGDYQLVARSVLQCDNAAGERTHALNDVVIKSAKPHSLIGLRVHSNEELVTDYYADGLILSTATGSTAYNLSSGGPIILPQAAVFVMTPICPHTLSNRSVVLPADTSLNISLIGREQPVPVAFDGINHLAETGKFPLSITLANEPLQLLQPQDHSHFHILRNKLGWGGEDRNPSQN